MEENNMLKIGLVGVGGISGAHIPGWERMADAELVALCDVRPERMERYPDKRHYTDIDEMLRCEQLDILDICLPTYLHADVAVKAMEKGIHVISEKPISLLEDDVKRVYDTARKYNVCFMVAQVLRFWPEYEYLKEVFDSGKYGKLLTGNMTRLSQTPGWSWDNWMKDENRSGLVPFDLHIHDLDFVVYAFGNPKSTHTLRSKRPEQDVLCAVYDYEDFYISAEAAWYASPLPFEAKFRFQFEKALLVYDGTLTVYEANGKIINLSAANGDTGDIQLPQTDAYANEINYFAQCVRQHQQPDKVKPEELAQVIRILKSF